MKTQQNNARWLRAKCFSRELIKFLISYGPSKGTAELSRPFSGIKKKFAFPSLVRAFAQISDEHVILRSIICSPLPSTIHCSLLFFLLQYSEKS